MNFTKFVDLVYSQELFFSHRSILEDKFEGALTINMSKKLDEFDKSVDAENEKLHNEKGLGDIPRRSQTRNIYTGIKDGIYINCWHMNDHESAAMWKLYAQYNQGIAIQSMYERWTESFSLTPIPIYCGVVNYKDYDNDPYKNNLLGEIFLPFTTKRKSFEYEQEIRAIISYNTLPNQSVCQPQNSGVKVQVNLEKLIENIYVSPNCQTWFTSLVQNVVDKSGLKNIVRNSVLDKSPLH